MKNEKLAEARKELGILAKEAAERIGITHQMYLQYEELFRYPSSTRQKQICDFYRKNKVFVLEEDLFDEEVRIKTYQKRKLNYPFKNIQMHYFADNNDQIPVNNLEATAILEVEEYKRIVDDLVGVLTSREQEVVHLMYGFNEQNQTHTITEVARTLGISKQRVDIIEKNALKKLRAYCGLRKLDEYFVQEHVA